MLKIKVRNMQSNRGNDVPNQFIIDTDEGIYFQSYSTIIAFESFETHITYLDRGKYDYSRTTSKYRNQFLGRTTKEVEAMIKDGRYVLTDLN
jgi:hypothetical protein